jgi:GNAT superfamily N-acetyltransferase
VEVRPATTADLPAIVSIGFSAWKDTYQDLLDAHTVDRYLTTSYSLDGICTRLDDHPILVAEQDDDVAAFADIIISADQMSVAEICTNEHWRRHGFATQLLAGAQALAPTLPMAAEVVLGNHGAERFYEKSGFVPGETVQADFFGQQIVQRRWWRHPEEAAAQ